MARIGKSRLLRRITDALDEGGWNYVLVSKDHPFVLSVFRDERTMRTRFYIWNITHGGGAARPPNEYRIQITSGVTQFLTAGVDRTVVLGWWEDAGVFAGFDVSKHLAPLGASPSLQIQRETLDKALIARVAAQRKSNDEIAIAFAPPFLGEYVAQLANLHSLAASSADLQSLAKVADDPAAAASVVSEATSEPRRIVLTQVARKLRDDSFKERVLAAYGNRCSVCSMQLRLVEAAHIVPVQVANDDATANGLALCSLHHRAFDRSLLTITATYGVALNPDRLDELAKLDLSGGLGGFRRALRPTIHLPPAVADRPRPTAIEKANVLRGWRRFQVLT